MLSNLIKRNKKKGFTLVELIIVIAILAILGLILVPQIGSYREKAEKSNIQASAKTELNAIQAYNADHQDTLIGGSDGTTAFGYSDLNNKIGSGASGDKSLDLSNVPYCINGNGTATGSDVANTLAGLQSVANGDFSVTKASGVSSVIDIH